MLRKREQVRLQVRERHGLVQRRGVIQNMQVAPLKINDLRPVWSFDIGVPDVPFFRYGPVEDRRSGGNFRDFEWNPAPNIFECLTNSLAGNASADRIQISGEGV